VLAFYLSTPTKPDTGVNSQLKELLTTLNSALSGNKFLVGVSYMHCLGDPTFCKVIMQYLPEYETLFFPLILHHKNGGVGGS
jgi:hypothetical protein